MAHNLLHFSLCFSFCQTLLSSIFTSVLSVFLSYHPFTIPNSEEKKQKLGQTVKLLNINCLTFCFEFFCFSFLEVWSFFKVVFQFQYLLLKFCCFISVSVLLNSHSPIWSYPKSLHYASSYVRFCCAFLRTRFLLSMSLSKVLSSRY